MADSTLKVNIVAVDKASAAMGKVSNAAGKMGKVGLVAAGGIAAFGASSVKAYSEAEAAQAKLQDTFDKFPRLADVSIDSLRDYNSELQKKTRFDDDAIASGQAILGQYELTGKQLQELTPLIADYAAKTGKSFEDASQDIGKALLGSGRALKSVGIDFKDTGTQAGNLEQVMVGLRGQVGGFAEEEAKTGAGAAERLKNQFGELQESVGKELLPPLVTLAGIASDMLIRFNELPGPVKNVTGAIVLLGVAALIAAPRVVALQTALSNAGGVKGAAGSLKKGLAGVAGFITGPWGLAMAGAVSVIGIMAAQHQEAKRKVEGYTEAIEADSGAIKENTRMTAINNLEKSGALKAAQSLGIELDTLVDAVLGNTDAQAQVKAALDETGYSLDGVRQKARDSYGSLNATETAVGDVATAVGLENKALRDGIEVSKRKNEALGDTEKNAKGAAGGIGELNEELDDGKTSIDRFRDALDGLAGGFLDLDEARDRAKGAQDDFAESLKQNGKTLSSNTEAGRNNKKALREIAESAKAASEAVFAVVEPTKGVEQATGRANQELAKGREAFIKSAMAAGRTRAQAEKLATQYGLLPKGVETKIKADTDPAIEKVKTFKEWAKEQGVTIPATLKISKNAAALLAGVTPGSPAAARIANDALDGKLAKGGPVRAGGTYLVGEKGPELFMPSGSGMIIPNGGGGRPVAGTGVTVNVYGSALASKQEIARVVTDALRSSGARGLATA